jgi:hypothetical protein
MAPIRCFRRLRYQLGFWLEGATPVTFSATDLSRRFACEADAGSYPANSHRLRHWLRSFLRPQGWACTTFHCDQVIWSFPSRCRFLIRTPPRRPGSNTASRTSSIWWAELRGLLQRWCATITPSARPRTRRAAFTAPGANEQIPQGWRPRGVGRREKTGGFAGDDCPGRPGVSRPGQPSLAGSRCRTSFSCCPSLIGCARHRPFADLSSPTFI